MRALWNKAVYWKLSIFKGLNGVFIIVGMFVLDKLHSMKWSNMDFDDKLIFAIATIVAASKALDMFFDQTLSTLKSKNGDTEIISSTQKN